MDVSAIEVTKDTAIRTQLDDLSKALRVYHSALLAFAREEYEFLHGKINSPYELYSLVTGHESFQWLRPLSGIMATLDEVLDSKTTLTQKNVDDIEGALGLLFSKTDDRFIAFRQGVARAQIPAVLEAEQAWRNILRRSLA